MDKGRREASPVPEVSCDDPIRNRSRRSRIEGGLSSTRRRRRFGNRSRRRICLPVIIDLRDPNVRYRFRTDPLLTRAAKAGVPESARDGDDEGISFDPDR